MPGKEEGDVQRRIKKEWVAHNFRVQKTHEMLSSGKPDLRVSRGDVGQLDIELKFKTTGDAGLITGITPRQRLTLKEMNEAGMPAIGLVYDSFNDNFFVTLDEQVDVRRILPSLVVTCMLKRVPRPWHVYRAAKVLLQLRDYPSHEFLKINR